jgi:hypothetical protein
MHKCPNCKQETIHFIKKFLTRPLLYHCPNCDACLCSSLTPLIGQVVLVLFSLLLTYFFPEAFLFRYAILLFGSLAIGYYWIFHSPIIIVGKQ